MFESLNGDDTYRMFKFFAGREVGFLPEQAVYLYKDMVKNGRVFPTSRRRIKVGGVDYPVDYVYPQDAVTGDDAAFIIAPDWFNGHTLPQCSYDPSTFDPSKCRCGRKVDGAPVTCEYCCNRGCVNANELSYGFPLD